MSDREKDPSRCRELRQIERTIRDEMTQTSLKTDRTWRAIGRKRVEIDKLRVESETLQRQSAVGIAASAMRGPRGAALGASLTRIEVQHQLLRHEIGHLQNQLQHLENDEQQLRRDHERWQAGLVENARRMDALTCVV